MSSQQYLEMEIATASPQALVVKFYEAALRHCRAAAGHHDAGRVRERGESIQRALAIVGELQHALDHEAGGEIAHNLEALYLFVSDRLLEAHVQQKRAALDGAQEILSQLHGAWVEIATTGAGTAVER